MVPGAHFAKTQIEGGLLQKQDRSKLSNWGNLDKGVLEQLAQVDPGNAYLVNWLWGYMTIGINVDKVKAAMGDTPMPDNAWILLFDPQYAAKLKKCGISVLDSASEVVPAALLYAGKDPYSKDAADYEAAAKVLKGIRPYVTRFSSSGYIEEMASGATRLVMGFSGDINIAASRAAAAKSKKPVVLQALVPKTCATLFFDSMAIPRDAKNVDNAHLFINYILRPEVHASLTNKVFYANPNAASLKFVKKDVAEMSTMIRRLRSQVGVILDLGRKSRFLDAPALRIGQVAQNRAVDQRKYQHHDGAHADDHKQTLGDSEFFMGLPMRKLAGPRSSSHAFASREVRKPLSLSILLLGVCGQKKATLRWLKSPQRDVVGFLSEVRLLLGRSSCLSHCDSS